MIEAGTGRRQQHDIARLRQLPCRGDRRLHAGCKQEPGGVGRLAGESRAIFTNQDRGAHMAPERFGQRGKILLLALATRDQNQVVIVGQAVDCGNGCADVGRLGIVDPAHAVALAHHLATVRQPAKLACRRERCLPIGAGELDNRQCRQHVQGIVATRHAQFGYRQQRLESPGEPVAAVS